MEDEGEVVKGEEFGAIRTEGRSLILLVRSRRWEGQSVRSFSPIEKRCSSGGVAGTSIMASSSSETSDIGDKSLASQSGDSDRDTIDAEKLTGDIVGDEGASISTSKLVSRSLLGEGKCMRRFHSSSTEVVIGSIEMEIGMRRDLVSSILWAGRCYGPVDVVEPRGSLSG